MRSLELTLRSTGIDADAAYQRITEFERYPRVRGRGALRRGAPGRRGRAARQ
ncbi:hypothetical protein LT493_06400 [Streptomyces tricolor]|nr:hypothetical protein [Streptomyces tricolor]